jgi:eukaryotic translation initiation factor 2C
MLCYTYCRATTGVSYATPTYYADRLCDRARLFLRRTWAGADDAYLLQLDARKAAHLQARQTARDNQYRNGQPFQAGGTKTLAEEQDEAGDNESLRLFARGEALTYAKNEFYGPNSHAGNPWHPDLAQVMFWM